MKSAFQKVTYALMFFCLASGLFYPSQVQADNTIMLTALETPYYQDFDSLSNSVESELLPIGWVLAESKTASNNKYQPNTGNFTTSDTYSYGSTNSTDRALGGIQDGNLVPLFGASFTNHVGGVIQSITIKYTGEEWRYSRLSRSDKLIFEISTDATSLNSGTWARDESLIFYTPFTGKVGARDGNSIENRQTHQYTFTGLTIDPGRTFWIRWIDFDALGDDDGLAVDDFSLTPFGRDNPPSLTAISPSENAANVALDAHLSVTFSEPVNLAEDWFSLNCSNSKQHAINVSGGPLTFVVDPVSDFFYGDSCTIKVEAAKVTDQDNTDPPDALDKSYSFSFTTLPPLDNAPIVMNTSPGNNDDDEVLLDSVLTVQFSEPVTANTGWFTLDCSKSGLHLAAVDGGPTVFTLTPQKTFQYSESCSLTINAQMITDVDVDDPPDMMPSDSKITFSTIASTDTAPYISSSTPVNDATSIPVNQEIEVVFSEPVAIDPGEIKITCDSKESFKVKISGGPTVYQLQPDHDFHYADRCTVTIPATSITDQDVNDPPDNMLMDQTINFQTIINDEKSPAILRITPADNAIDVAINSNIAITFTEEVSVTKSWADLICSISGTHSYITTGTSLTQEINPDMDFATKESCKLTILATEIHDLDTKDPPDEMTENYSITFTTASQKNQPPKVLETYPSDKAVGVSLIENIIVFFSEPVEILGGAADLSCPKSKTQFTSTEIEATKYIFGFEGFLANSEECTVTLKADKIYALGENDIPEFMSADYVFSFTTEKSLEEIVYPTIEDDGKTIPKNGDYLYKSLFHLLIHFNKDVLHDGSSEAADNIKNYCLIEYGLNNNLESTSCADIGGDDAVIPIERITYDPQNYQADLIVNYATNLPDGTYRLIVSGEHSIKDLFGNLLNNGVDATITFTILNQDETVATPINGTGSGDTPNDSTDNGSDSNKNTNYSTNNSTHREVPLIPITGFPRGKMSLLSPQITTYADLGDVWLEVPELDLETSITGVPKINENWDVTWLGNSVGWLEGSAFPSFEGNSVLTAHVWDALNQPGPFYGLEKLAYGDQVIVHAWGDEYVYEVREVFSVKPENVNAMMKHQERSWLTLVTCQGYDEDSGEYQKRILVRAVLVEVR